MTNWIDVVVGPGDDDGVGELIIEVIDEGNIVVIGKGIDVDGIDVEV
jgi:hypothetical protein